MTLSTNSDEPNSDPIAIRRTPNNLRIRPDTTTRHDPFGDIGGTFQPDFLSNSALLREQDLEWMSFNYRKYRMAKMSPSKRRMILQMFEEDF